MWLAIIATGALTSLVILSFVVTPVKFLAAGVPLEQLLAVGRVTFRASLVCEAAFLASLMIIARKGAMAGRRSIVVASYPMALFYAIIG